LGLIFGPLGRRPRKGSLGRVKARRAGQGRPRRGPKRGPKGPLLGPFLALLGPGPGGNRKPKQGKHPGGGPTGTPQKGPFRALFGPFRALGAPSGHLGGGPGRARSQTRNRGNIRASGPRQGALPPDTPRKGPNSGIFGAPRPESMLQDGVFSGGRAVVVLEPRRPDLMGGGRGVFGRKTAKNPENRENPLERGLVLGGLGKG